ncbi:MAG: folate-binding protein YgfZ [Oscillatoriales cyanobacterium C42_A2020_001]|nr:folate-binding protein YgfZ [Leptolyngbyaceae cyanobacterium C42_A2020_001]
MTQPLQDSQLQAGAVFEENAAIPISFGNDAIALKAVQTGVAVCDRSHWGRLQLTDADRKTFLHNQSTNDFNTRQPGEGCDTIFVTSTARTIDLATAYVLEDAVIVVVSPNRRDYLMKWLDRYIFFGDKVKLQDITKQTVMFNLIGPESHSLLETLGVVPLRDRPYASHQVVMLAGQPVRVAVGSGLVTEGYTLLMNVEKAANVWDALLAGGAVPMGDRVWEQLRVQQGRPRPDHELTDDYNAVEACLWQAISINKGCYIGQETIARLDTYKGVKQQIWGMQLTAQATPGTPITLKEEKIGVLTSVTNSETGLFGLGYVRTKAGGAGLEVQVGEQTATLVDVPFLRRERLE